MSMELTTRENGDVIIVDTIGQLTLGEGTSALRGKMRELVDGVSRRILLNLAGVTYMDSSGLGELVAAYTTVTAAGGQVKLLNLAKHAHDLLEITKLYAIFETFEDEASALASFPASRPTDLQVRWARFMRRIAMRSLKGKGTASPIAGWDDEEDLLPGMVGLHGSCR